MLYNSSPSHCGLPLATASISACISKLRITASPANKVQCRHYELVYCKRNKSANLKLVIPRRARSLVQSPGAPPGRPPRRPACPGCYAIPTAQLAYRAPYYIGAFLKNRSAPGLAQLVFTVRGLKPISEGHSFHYTGAPYKCLYGGALYKSPKIVENRRKIRASGRPPRVTHITTDRKIKLRRPRAKPSLG